MLVPYNDLSRQNINISEFAHLALESCITNSSFIAGKHVSDFEKDFARACASPYSVGCANGTDALLAALKCVGLKAGAEVIVPAVSWIATSEVVSLLGARPVFCDVNYSDGTINPELISVLINQNTVGIIPVHLHGHCCAMDKIMQIANENFLWVIEDCAQAHLARYNDKAVGTFDRFGTFSFFPGKNLGALGDAGGVICKSEADSIWLKKFINHGSIVKNEHDFEGVNSRLDEFQAIILSEKLKFLHDWTETRKRLAKSYYDHLSAVPGLTLPEPSPSSESVWHIFAVKTEKRDGLREYLTKRGIGTGIHYPLPLPLLRPYSQENVNKNFKTAIRFTENTLSLPLFPEMTIVELEFVVTSIKEYFNVS